MVIIVLPFMVMIHNVRIVIIEGKTIAHIEITITEILLSFSMSLIII